VGALGGRHYGGSLADVGPLYDVLYVNPVGPLLVGLVAGAAVLVTVAVGSRLVAVFEPFEGEPVRRGVPSPVALGTVTAVVVGVLVWRLWGRDLGLLPAYLFLAVLGVVLAAVDLRVHRLPDALVLPSYGILVALLGGDALLDRYTWGSWSGGGQSVADAAVGAAVPLALFGALHLFRRGGLGLGDVKLVGLLGMGLGWTRHLSLVPLALLLGALSAGLWTAFQLVTGRARRSDAVPYGPHLLLGALLAFVLGGY